MLEMPSTYKGWTAKKLIEFEKEIASYFEEGLIRGPIHLSGGNEQKLIDLFAKNSIDENTWCFSTHRSHLHALLKGISPEWLKNEILQGRSMHIFSQKHKFFTSAMVGGIAPIALGVAMAIKRKNSTNWVWAFVGDMAAETGIFHECVKYASRNDLPITFVVEDNGLSTNTPTQLIWGESKAKPNIIRYRYERFYPHVGVGKWVTF